MARLRLVREQIKEIEQTRLERLAKAPREGTHPMMLMLAMLKGIGIETADMLVHEILSRNLRDRRALARYAGLTGSPDESGSKRREKGLARAGNARVRRSMIQLAWRWLMFQKQQRAGAVVRGAHRRPQEQRAQDHDRGLGAQAADRAVALCDLRRGAGGRHPAPRGVSD